MNEKFKIESDNSPEDPEDQKYREYQEAEHEENRIMREIDRVFATTGREEAEKIVVEKWDPLMKEAQKKSREALQAWLDTKRDLKE